MGRVLVIVGGGAVSRSDAGAVMLAAQRLGGPFDAVSMGGGEEALRLALASGATSAGWASGEEALEFDVALAGAGGRGAMGDLLPARLARRRGAALVLDVLDVEATAGGLRVTRDLGRGAREVISVMGPAVLAVSEEARRGRYVSRYRREHAHVSGGRAVRGAEVAWEPARPRAKTAGIAKKTGGSATDRMHAAFGVAESAQESASQIVNADAATCAKHLLRFLSHHGIIQRKTVGAGATPVEERSDAIGRQSDEGTADTGGQNVAAAAMRGPRPIDGPARGMSRRPRPLVLARVLGIDVKRDRGPRNVDGATLGVSRRPRPFSPAVAPQAASPTQRRLARGPRSVSFASRTKIRGPFPC